MASTAIRVEDDDAFRALLLGVLRAAGHETVDLEDGGELGDYLELSRAKAVVAPDLILTDLRMPGWSGLEVVRRERGLGLDCPVVLLTAFPAPELLDEAERIGQVTVLGKPIELDAVVRCISGLVAATR